MDFLLEYILKFQTVSGCIRFFVSLICWPLVIRSFNDRQEFKCTPKPDEVTLHLCYDNYTSTMSPLLTPLNFSYATACAIDFLWLVITVYSVKDLPQIKREKDNEKKKHHLNSYWCKFLFHVCMELAVLIIMMVVFCSQTINFPETYMCSIGETPFNKVVNITCNDLQHRHKSRLNVFIIIIMFVSMILCGVVIGCALKRGKTRLIADLVNLETDSSDGRSSERYSGGNERRESGQTLIRVATEPDRPSSSVLRIGSPSIYELKMLAMELGDSWRPLARRLCHTDAELLEIDQQSSKISEKVMKMLLRWKEREGSNATYSVLHKALTHPLVRRADLAVNFQWQER